MLVTAVVSGTVLLGACSGTPAREDTHASLDRYYRYAGEPIERFSYLGPLNGWDVLDGEHLVVYTSVNDGYLLTVELPCRDLQFKQAIALSSTGSSVTRGADFVTVGPDRCRISEIRKVDYGQLKRDLRAEHH
jgi:hypothetical protein